jgi:hypothetical protein
MSSFMANPMSTTLDTQKSNFSSEEMGWSGHLMNHLHISIDDEVQVVEPVHAGPNGMDTSEVRSRANEIRDETADPTMPWRIRMSLPSAIEDEPLQADPWTYWVGLLVA